MSHTFEVYARLAPHVYPSQLPRKALTGSFSYGALNAARDYVMENMPDYQVIPGGVAYHNFRRFEAINHNIGYGAEIFVKEL